MGYRKVNLGMKVFLAEETAFHSFSVEAIMILKKRENIIRGAHEYLISKTILDSNLIISVPS